MARSDQSHGGLLEILRKVFCKLAREYCPPEKPPRPCKAGQIYFAPGQISVLVEHSIRLNEAEIAELTRATSFLRDRRLGTPVFIPPERVVTFQRGPEDFFSVVFVEAPALYNNAVGLIRAVISFNQIIDRQGGDNTNPGQQPDGYKAGPAQTTPDAPAATGQARAAAPGSLIVRRFSPNWTAGGSSQGIGGGGPGARPVPPATPISVAPITPSPWDITLNNLIFFQPREQLGAGVDVAILDTMPDQQQITDAYTNWNTTNPHIAPNPLIERLFGPGGPLRFSPGGYSHLLNLASFHMDDATYVMSDHGIFVAGIINSIAPQATIHLIEVLNPLGVGTLETIVRGFKMLVDDRTQGGVIADSPPLVVNASLVLRVPTPTLLDALNAAAQDQATQDAVSQELALAGIDASTLASTNAALEAICNLLQQHNVHIVAAAGNDNAPALPNRPEAGYPAALTNVLGVGALDQLNQATEYSNVSDLPQTNGLAVFGGIRADNGLDTDNTTAMLSIYLGDFPTTPPPPNIQGWARWAGTSFAAPIISGGIAAVISDRIAQNLPPLADPEQPLRDASPGLFSAIGKVVEVHQG